MTVISPAEKSLRLFVLSGIDFADAAWLDAASLGTWVEAVDEPR